MPIIGRGLIVACKMKVNGDVDMILGHGMRFLTMWHFDMCRLGRASADSF